MRGSIVAPLLLLASTLAAGCAATPAPEAPLPPLPPLTDRYRLVAVGGLPGASGCDWQAINASGVLAGMAYLGETTTAVVALPRAGGAYDVLALDRPAGARFAGASGVNDAGVVAGAFSFAEDDSRVFIARPGPDGRYTVEDLGVPPGAKPSLNVTGINAAGVLCGDCQRLREGDDSPTDTRAFIARPGASGRYEFQDLGVPPGCAESIARAIDGAGDVAVSAGTASSVTGRPFVARLRPDGRYEWVALPLPAGAISGDPFAIGDGGACAGTARFSSAKTYTIAAVVWTPTAAGGYEAHALADPSDGGTSAACGVNARGAVAGRSHGKQTRAPNGKLSREMIPWIALPSGPGAWRVAVIARGPKLGDPQAINAAGVIAFSDGVGLPEPPTGTAAPR
jgi:hypothetical protein